MFRIGIGYDVHRLEEGYPLIIGGVKIPFEKGLKGHSDADVLVHAICDAILGAVALGDIGEHFPDSDEKYKGISSLILLKEVNEKIKNLGYQIENVDSIIIAQRPKLFPYKFQMRKNIAKVLEIPVDRISIKATTTERLGFEGRGEGISAQSVVLLRKI
ncbi:2-C-methyl-D-erythritol 2,4-cyclodiphosphate synthase [Desulfurobacterium thermolithotrophum DSM 11699]|uniref:2-C-methyl-D-erythritol 2,4-cyclodiphosphate synthase n=1 Tax=Desulfurobacterium thermolithotrophum (strain DSM 11699 / BSA) TaxID=868864 RepID=F0S2Z4_DESTD|nr:2-C-methyl-D-erythritol 2,4-cyclodiphosphate synthase [Desulfurobacterium thermolithotrophum]ADY73216.1 2-C-methyl-D-erythritol 2,4-cyclodiphosphate synthase [Desulfurobacterium thermolithotrophum DSM 11699]